MTEAFICDAVRTPIGRYAGALSSVRADDLVPLAGAHAAGGGGTGRRARQPEAAAPLMGWLIAFALAGVGAVALFRFAPMPRAATR